MIASILGAVVIAVLGWRVSLLASIADEGLKGYLPWGLVLTLAGAILGAIAGPLVIHKSMRRALDELNRIPSTTLVAATIGLVIGLIVASLISIPIFQLQGWPGWGVPIIISGVLGCLGLAVAVQRERDLRGVFPSTLQSPQGRWQYNGRILMDTSAIIDGRIADLTQTGFLQGTLVVPRFVLDELRHIADSSDSLRRTRGRRGLEVLSKLRQEGKLPVQVLDADLLNGAEVDGELVELAKKMKAHILTTDYNLNRVAELQGVKVLNVNELTNALRPVVLPGEDLTVNIIQEGREAGQGVAFLDDGTMVVVDGGKRFINSVQDVAVTRVFQTAAGRIIFTQLRGIY